MMPSRVSLGTWNGMFLMTIAVGILHSQTPISSCSRPMPSRKETHTSSSGPGRPTSAAYPL